MLVRFFIGCVLLFQCRAQVLPCIPGVDGVHFKDAKFLPAPIHQTSTQNLHVHIQADYDFVLQFTANALSCTYNSTVDPQPGTPIEMLNGCNVNATNDIQSLFIPNFTLKPNQTCQLVFTMVIGQQNGSLSTCKTNSSDSWSNDVITPSQAVPRHVNCSVEFNSNINLTTAAPITTTTLVSTPTLSSAPLTSWTMSAAATTSTPISTTTVTSKSASTSTGPPLTTLTTSSNPTSQGTSHTNSQSTSTSYATISTTAATVQSTSRRSTITTTSSTKKVATTTAPITSSATTLKSTDPPLTAFTTSDSAESTSTSSAVTLTTSTIVQSTSGGSTTTKTQEPIKDPISCLAHSICTPTTNSIEASGNCVTSGIPKSLYVRISAQSNDYYVTTKMITINSTAFSFHETVNGLSPGHKYRVVVEVSQQYSFKMSYDQEICNVTTLPQSTTTATITASPTFMHLPADDTCIHQATSSQVNVQFSRSSFESEGKAASAFTFILMSMSLLNGETPSETTLNVIQGCAGMNQFQSNDYKQGCAVLSRDLEPTDCCVAQQNGSCSNVADSGQLRRILLGSPQSSDVMNVVFQTCDDSQSVNCVPQLPDGTLGLAIAAQYGVQRGAPKYGALEIQRINISSDKSSGITNTQIYIIVGVGVLIICIIALGIFAQKGKKPVYRERKIVPRSESHIPSQVSFDDESISVSHSAQHQLRGQQSRGPRSSHSIPTASILKPQNRPVIRAPQKFPSAQLVRPIVAKPPSAVDWIALASKPL